MLSHYLSLGIAFVLIAVLFFLIGATYERVEHANLYSSNVKRQDVIDKFIKQFALVLFLLVVSAICFIRSYKFVEMKAVNEFREGVLVEQVKYKVTEQEGRITHRDSTIQYVRVK